MGEYNISWVSVTGKDSYHIILIIIYSNVQQNLNEDKFTVCIVSKQDILSGF